MTAVWSTESREQDGSKKTSWTAAAIWQEVSAGFVYCSRGRGSEKSSNSGYLLKVKPTDLAEGLHARCEGKRELKNDP